MPFDGADVPALVPVFAANRYHADVVKSVLEGSGIPAVVVKEGYAEAYPLTVGAIGEGRVLIREQDFDRAREVLAAVDEGAPTQGPIGDSPTDMPYERPAWFWVLATVICLLAVVGLILSNMQFPPISRP